MKSLSYGRLWSHRDFNRLWFSDTVSQIGNQFTNLTLPILAVLSLHAGAFEIGLLMALQTLFFPILGLFVGVWADRLKKRPIMIVCNLGRMAGLASIPLAFFLSSLTLYQLYAVAAVNGIFTVFFEISYQSYLPVLIDREDLVEGNSKLQTSASGAQVVGPALAGFVYQLVGGAITIAVDAIGYLISGLSLISIRKREAKPESNSPTGHPDFLEEMKEGIRTVFDNPPLANYSVYRNVKFRFRHGRSRLCDLSAQHPEFLSCAHRITRHSGRSGILARHPRHTCCHETIGVGSGNRYSRWDHGDQHRHAAGDIRPRIPDRRSDWSDNRHRATDLQHQPGEPQTDNCPRPGARSHECDSANNKLGYNACRSNDRRDIGLHHGCHWHNIGRWGPARSSSSLGSVQTRDSSERDA